MRAGAKHSSAVFVGLARRIEVLPSAAPMEVIACVDGKVVSAHQAHIAFDVVDGKRKAVLLPQGTTVHVVRPPDGEGLVGLQCALGTVLMFAIDLTARGEPIPERHTTASP